MTISENINFLKTVIEKEVFVTKDQARIADGEDSRWLMDFRRVLLKPQILNAVSEIFFEKAGSAPFQIGGIEVASIPLISGIVMKSVEKEKPVNGFFIRKSRKKTGLLNMVEGVITDERIVLVDDILNRGFSFRRQIEVIESLGKKVDTVMVILKYRDEAYYKELVEKGIRIISLFTLDDFTTALSIKNQIEDTQAPHHPYVKKWAFKSEGEAHYEHVVPKSRPLLSDGVLYFGTDSGNFYALDVVTGLVKWTFKVPFGVQGKLIFSSPCILGDTLFFGAYNGNFYALDRNTGKKKWTAYQADWIGSSPCVASDLGLVYVGMEFGFWKHRGGVAAYDAKTGKLVWQSHSSEVTHGSPSYSKKNKMVVCGSNDGIVHGLHARSGKVLWTYNAGGEVKERCELSPSERYIAFGSFNSNFVVLETSTGKEIAVFKTMEANYSTPAWDGNDMLICSSLDKRIYKFNIKEKKTEWIYVTNSRIFASPIVNNGKVYCGNNSARLYVLDLATGKEIAFFQTTERITNAVVIDKERDLIYVPTFANEIIAIQEKPHDEVEVKEK
jgi:orotate phosphoribosyltransferase